MYFYSLVEDVFSRRMCVVDDAVDMCRSRDVHVRLLSRTN